MTPVKKSTGRIPLVFIPEDSGHDFSSAASKGEIVFLHDGRKVNVFASDKLLKNIADKMKESRPEDYLVLAGNQLAASMAFSLLLRKHGRVNVLIWSHKFSTYEVRTVREGQFTAADAAVA